MSKAPEYEAEPTYSLTPAQVQAMRARAESAEARGRELEAKLAWLYNITAVENVPIEDRAEVDELIRLERERLNRYRTKAAQADALETELARVKADCVEVVAELRSERDAAQAQAAVLKTENEVLRLRLQDSKCSR